MRTGAERFVIVNVYFKADLEQARDREKLVSPSTTTASLPVAVLLSFQFSIEGGHTARWTYSIGSVWLESARASLLTA